MLSVEPVQLSVALPIAPVAVNPVGAVGGCVSSHGAGKRTIEATDGTPFEWYSRPMWSDATSVHVSVSGFQISAGRTALVRSMPSEPVMPPLARTFPSGSKVMFWYERAECIGDVERQAGEPAFISRTAVF